MPAAQPYADYFAILTAVMCIVGHTFPVWLGFKGGKGVATSAGALFGLMPLVVPYRRADLGYYLRDDALCFGGFDRRGDRRYRSSLAWLSAGNFWMAPALLYFSIFIALLVLWSHRSNFSRLLNGTEQRFTRK